MWAQSHLQPCVCLKSFDLFLGCCWDNTEESSYQNNLIKYIQQCKLRQPWYKLRRGHFYQPALVLLPRLPLAFIQYVTWMFSIKLLSSWCFHSSSWPSASPWQDLREPRCFGPFFRWLKRPDLAIACIQRRTRPQFTGHLTTGKGCKQVRITHVSNVEFDVAPFLKYYILLHIICSLVII